MNCQKNVFLLIMLISATAGIAMNQPHHNMHLRPSIPGVPIRVESQATRETLGSALPLPNYIQYQLDYGYTMQLNRAKKQHEHEMEIERKKNLQLIQAMNKKDDLLRYYESQNSISANVLETLSQKIISLQNELGAIRNGIREYRSSMPTSCTREQQTDDVSSDMAELCQMYKMMALNYEKMLKIREEQLSNVVRAVRPHCSIDELVVMLNPQVSTQEASALQVPQGQVLQELVSPDDDEEILFTGMPHETDEKFAEEYLLGTDLLKELCD